jgi:hypothetical protein
VLAVLRSIPLVAAVPRLVAWPGGPGRQHVGIGTDAAYATVVLSAHTADRAERQGRGTRRCINPAITSARRDDGCVLPGRHVYS